MRRFFTTYEAAHMLGVSLPTVVNWVKAKRLKAHKTPGGHRRIAREELAGFMARHGIPIPADLADVAEARRKALVVGEDGPVRQQVAHALDVAGLSVASAPPGFSAGVATARLAPDVLVLVAGPRDGVDTVAALRADGALSAMPVVAVADPELGVLLHDQGCTVVSPRALSDGSLAATVVHALSHAVAAVRRR